MGKDGIHYDSIGRCEIYSNPYDVRAQSNPALIKQRAELYAKTQDTIENSLERQLLLRLQNANFFTTIGNLVFLAKVGKFAFLALVLPPYIFFYGIPKWLLTQGFPKVYQVASKFTHLLGGVAHKFVGVMKNQVAKITSPILQYIQTSVEKTRELFLQLGNRASQLYGLATYPFRLVIDPLKDAYKKLVSLPGDGVKTLLDKMDAFRQELRKVLINLPGDALDKAEALLQQLKGKMSTLAENLKTTLLPVQNWFAGQSQKIENAYDHLAKGVQERLDRFVYRPLANARDYLNKVRASVIEKVASYTNPIEEWMRSKGQALKTKWKDGKEKLSDFKEKSKQAFKNKSKELWNGLVSRSSRVAKTIATVTPVVVQEIAQIIPQPVISLFAPVLYVMGGAMKFPLKVYRSREKIKEKYKKIKEKVKKGILAFNRMVRNIAFSVGRGVKHLFDKAKLIPKIAYRILKKVLQVLWTAIKGTFLLMRLMLAWIWALLRYGLFLVKETASNWV